jgi:hypothetical protein
MNCTQIRRLQPPPAVRGASAFLAMPLTWSQRASEEVHEKEHPMIELTEEQQQALDAEPETRLVDPRTQKTYVLLQADTFERLRGILADDSSPDMSQVAVLVERAMQEDDLNDPSLEFYQQKYGRRK